MKTKIYHMLLVLLILSTQLLGQEDKNPIAENDFTGALALETIEISVLENDFAYDNHPFKIFLAFGGLHGTFDFNDSIIFYTPELSYSGLDSISYNIKDLENNLISEFAKVYIEITNEGFAILDANQVSCRINSFGLQYWDLGSDSDFGYEVPKGSGKHTIFSESFWIGGLGETGELHLAAERYRQLGKDFFPGPVMDSAAYSTATDILWNRVWKLSSDEVDYHRLHWQDEDYTPIKNIAEWPGNGQPELGQAKNLAPYYDWNNNELYDPENGDFPLIKGDVAIFFIVNDDRDVHTESGGKKLRVEIQTMYYAYNQPDDSALSYTTFCDRRIINRSEKDYHDFYVGTFLDFDIGFFNDDYVGCDTTLSSAFAYNGFQYDGYEESYGYGEHPPAQSYTCLNHDMDGFVYFFSYGQPTAMSDPDDDVEYYNYLTGRWRDSTLFTYGGTGYGGTEPVKFIFPGDPVTNTGWTEYNALNVFGDRRGLVISGSYNMNSGDTLQLVNALVFARDYSGDHLSSLALLKTRIQEVHDFYQNSLGVDYNRSPQPVINTFPNPCKDFVYVEWSDNFNEKQVDFSVIDLMGKNLRSGKLNSTEGSAIDLRGLPPGIYFVKFTFDKNVSTRKIIIQSH